MDEDAKAQTLRLLRPPPSAAPRKPKRPQPAKADMKPLVTDAHAAQDAAILEGGNMQTITVREALRDAMAEEMRR
jgi:hypothetical protein